MYLRIRKEILELTRGRAEGNLKIYLKSPIATYFRENKERMERQIRRTADVVVDDTLPWEQYKIILE
jgi:hypothetical protein